MEKREPSLVPEWLRSSRHGSNQRSSHSDSSSWSNHSKNMTSRRTSDVDSVQSLFLDRSSSTNTRRGSSNGFTKNAYNLSRSNINKDWSRERDRLRYKDPCDFDTPFPLRTFMIGKEHKQLRRSYSMTTRKHGSHLTQGLTVGLNNGGSINLYNRKGTLPGNSLAKIPKRIGFDKDFPLLRAAESNGGPNVVRISSPGLCRAIESLPIGKSALIAGKGWTSVLAEAPNVIDKTGGGSHDNVGNSATSMGPTARNITDALGARPQGYVNTQRLESRDIKPSRQLIPVGPSTPKSSGLNSSAKSLAKPMVRSGERGIASLRNTQQQSSMLLANLQSNPGSQIMHGTIRKLVLLKPARKNGVVAIKESGSPTAASQHTSQVTTFVRSTNSPRELIAGRTSENKPFLAQTQSRNAFYRALKQNSSTNMSTDPSKTSSCILSFVEEKENSLKELSANGSSSRHAAFRDEIIERIEKVYEVIKRNNSFEKVVHPDEKEAKFLKSLGWDENNSEEDGALTEEEIRAFIEQYKKRKPSLVRKLPFIQEAANDVTPTS